MSRDLYEALGVPRDSDAPQIKKAFRKLARELPPDVNRHDPEAEEKFKEAAEAYEVLSDPERRRTYDTFGHEGLRSGGWAPRADAFGSFEGILSTFFGRGDPMFSDLFGFTRSGPAGGADVAARVEVTLEEVLTGTTRDVAFEGASTCERCEGSGGGPGTEIRTCETCGGAGEGGEGSRTVFGELVRSGLCPTCGGRGEGPQKARGGGGGGGGSRRGARGQPDRFRAAGPQRPLPDLRRSREGPREALCRVRWGRAPRQDPDVAAGRPGRHRVRAAHPRVGRRACRPGRGAFRRSVRGGGRCRGRTVRASRPGPGVGHRGAGDARDAGGHGHRPHPRRGPGRRDPRGLADERADRPEGNRAPVPSRRPPRRSARSR